MNRYLWYAAAEYLLAIAFGLLAGWRFAGHEYGAALTDAGFGAVLIVFCIDNTRRGHAALAAKTKDQDP